VHELEALTATELRDLIDSGVSVAVVPFGSIEHQGTHLPLGADALLADTVGREVARRLGAVLAPTFRVGCATEHSERFGTVSLRTESLTDVAFEVGESLVRQGFELVVLVSTHGGNEAGLDAAVARLGPVACAPRGDVGPEPGRHSGRWLTSVMLALRPDLVRLDRASRELAAEVRATDARRGAEHVERFVQSIVAVVPSR